MAISLPALAQVCPEPVAVAEIEVRLQAAEQAYTDLDVEGFNLALDESVLMLPCLDQAVPPRFAARMHRDLALRFFVGRETEKASQALAASRAADPGSTFPEALVPTSHSIQTLWGTVVSSYERVPEPEQGQLIFDGVPGVERPGTRPTIVQLQAEDGSIVVSAYLVPENPLPPYRVRLPTELAVAEPTVAEPVAAGRRRVGPGALLWTGAAAGAASSVVLYALASGSAATFEEYHAGWTTADLQAQRRQTNSLVAGAMGVGVLALGSGVGAVLVTDW
ncbi:MAG: hypothetical protein QGG40_01220 [Myxococcota bacterium]|jgi:hypothetical protein|nr:hypothetical protein [Myxococcota bacterium]